MDIGKLTDQAKKIVDERGGVDALKKDPGAPGESTAPGESATPTKGA